MTPWPYKFGNLHMYDCTNFEPEKNNFHNAGDLQELHPHRALSFHFQIHSCSQSKVVDLSPAISQQEACFLMQVFV